MKPDLTIIPAPGTPLTAGAATVVSWTNVPSVDALVLAGTGAGESDLAFESLMSTDPQQISFDAPASGAVHVTLVLGDAGADPGESFAYWPVYPIAGDWYDGFASAVHAAFNAYWIEEGGFLTEGAMINPPIVVPINGAFSPGIHPFVTIEVMGAITEGRGGKPLGTELTQGLFQVNLYVPSGTGEKLLTMMGGRVRRAWEAINVKGLRCHKTGTPHALPEPPTGFYGAHVDTEFHWIFD